MQYTEKELEKLINEVEKEFTSHLAKAEETFNLAKSEGSAAVESLAKAEDGKKPEEKKPEAKEEGKEEQKPEGEKPPVEGEKKPEGEAPPAAEGEKPPVEGEAPPAQAQGNPAQGEEGCDYDAQDLDHMQKMYMSMSKGELKAHHDSVKAALDGKGMAKCGEMSMNKSETATSIEVKAEIVKPEPTKELELLKSESAAKDAKIEGLQKSLDVVTVFLNKLFEKKGAPAGKAITSMDVIAKSEGTSTEVKVPNKDEIDTILSKKAQDPKLEKSDRDKINSYCLNGKTDIDSIRHLLK